MKFLAIVSHLLFTASYAFAQYGTPQHAKEIVPTGQLPLTVSKGWGVWALDLNDPAVKSKPTKQVFSRKPGNCCWLKFKTQNSDQLWFTIKIVNSVKPPAYDFPEFLIYQFSGSGDSLQQLIETGKIQPIRITGFSMYDGNYSLHGSGLSPFETDTFLKDPGTTGYLKPLQAEKGTQYYLVIQSLCWLCGIDEQDCIERCIATNNKVSICFGSFCGYPPLTLRNVSFASGNSKITGKVYQLDRLASLLKSDTSLKILITGHTDSIGDISANQELSEKRAVAVENYLKAQGIKTSQIAIKGKGESEPLVPNDTEENRALNRRVVVAILPKPK